MNEILTKMANAFIESRRRHKRWLNFVVSISLIVVISTIYMLIKPSIAIEKQIICGMEEHIHAEECYNDAGELICTMEEHTHSDECYETVEEETAPEAEEEVTEKSAEADTDESITEEAVTEEQLFEGIDDEEHGVLVEDTPVDRDFNSDDANNDDVISDDIISGGSLEVNTKEKLTEEIAEELTETTTEYAEEISLFNMRAISYEGSFNDVLWNISINASGDYTLTFSGTGKIPDNVMNLSALKEYGSLVTNVIIKDGITEIGKNAFKDSTSIENVEFEQNTTLTAIDSGAFNGCSALHSVNIDNCTSLERIGDANVENTNIADKNEVIEKGVFAGSGIKSIAIPKSVITIDHCAFYGCKDLTDVVFEKSDEDKLTTFGGAVFAECSSLTNVNLQDVRGQIYTKTLNGNCALFENCKAIKNIAVPSGFGYENSSISRIFAGCRGLESLVFENNYNITGKDGQINNIVNNDVIYLDVLDLSPFKVLEITGNYSIRGGMERVILPSSIKTINTGAISDDSGISFVEFAKDAEGKNSLTTLDARAFERSSIKEIDFTGTSLTYINSNAFQNCKNLAKVVLPESLTGLGINVFLNCSSLNEIVYNANSMNVCSSGIFNNAPADIHFTIGKNVDNLNYKFIKEMQGHIGSFTFEGENTFEVANGDFTDFSAPLNKAGKYYADGNGNLYRLNDDNTAEFLYADRNGYDKLTIPAVITSDSVQYTVTAIGSNAFEGSFYKSVELAEPLNITSVDYRAFAGAVQLADINGLKDAESIEKLLANATFGNDVFLKTLIAAKAFETGIKANGSDINNNELQLQAGRFEYLTGETGTVRVNLSNSNTGHRYRVYFRCSDGCIFDTLDINNLKIEAKPTDTEGIYYYELPQNSYGQTISGDIGFSYPNLMAPGNRIQVWSVMGTEDSFASLGNQAVLPSQSIAGNTAGNEYYDMIWNTRPLNFNITKEHNADAKPSFKTADDGKTVIDNLSYVIAIQAIEGQDVNIGSDHVKFVDYRDVLSLPSNIHWREGIDLNSVRSVISGDGKSAVLCAMANGVEYKICSITLDTEEIENAGFEKTADGKYAICWRAKNRNTDREISLANTKLTFGPEIIVADSIIENDEYEIVNNVDTTRYYCFSDYKSAAADTLIMVGTGKGNIVLTKEMLNKAEYWGEDVDYVINVENPSAFPYKEAVRIWDDLGKADTTQYLTPENMEAMFNGGVDDPQYLKITIEHAVLTQQPKRNSVIAVDGETTAIVSAKNTGADLEGHYEGLSNSQSGKEDKSMITNSAVITLKLNEAGNITVNVAYGGKSTDYIVGEGYSGIYAIFDEIGYIVTQKDYYKMVWEYPENYIFPSGVKKEYAFRATVKNTFEYLDGDQQLYYGYPNYNVNQPLVQNTAYGEKADGTRISGDRNTNELRPKNDIDMRKFAFVDGVEFGNKDAVIEDGKIAEYEVWAAHHGKGTYELLPIVDHMGGMQAVLASVDENKDALWADHAAIYTDKSGKKYYVLNKKGYIYKGVWLDGYFADSVDVSAESGGLCTIIKWYFKDTPNKEYTYKPKYRAIISNEYAGNENTQQQFSVSNEAWVNDHPTYRIHDVVGSKGATVGFNKKIVTKEANIPENDELADNSSITRDENIVEYRLRFYNIGNKGTELKGSDIYDMLPVTDDGKGSAIFNWDKSRISLKYKCSDGVSIKYNGTDLNGRQGGSEWSIADSIAGKNHTVKLGQQYIKWDDNFVITFDENKEGNAYIYVFLTFPNDIHAEGTGTWNEYIAAKGSAVLKNTLYTFDMPSTVTHNLSEPGKVLLQKGVYETGYYMTNGNELISYYRGSDRYHYGKNHKNNPVMKQTVTYYVVLKNSGTTRLYLSPIYDVLPEGFEFARFCSKNDGTKSAWGVGGCPNLAESVPVLTDEGGEQIAKVNGSSLLNINITLADKNTDLGNGRKRLKFDFADGTQSQKVELPTDDKGAYLNPGEYIQFGYTCFTGGADINEAVNTVAMEYIDYDENGVVADKDTDIDVSHLNGFGNNDGDRRVIYNDEAASLGFTEVNSKNDKPDDVDFVRQWLVSDVSVVPGGIVPGITKSVNSPMAKFNAPVEWTIHTFNNGLSPISDYVIEDTMEAPYKIQGSISYTIYSNTRYFNKHWVYGNYSQDGGYELLKAHGWTAEQALFKIEERKENEDYVTIKSNMNETFNLKIGNTDGVTFKSNGYILKKNNPYINDFKGMNGYNRINVSMSRDVNGNEKLKIRFIDPVWSIPQDGYGELKLSTVMVPEKPMDDVFVNEAIFRPDDLNYKASNVTQGKNITDENGNNAGVINKAPVSVYSDVATSSYKEIREVGNESNYGISANAAKDGQTDHILLGSRNSLFRYTLNVQNSQDIVMDKFIVIDNLPEIGDHSTLRESMSRNSEFKVMLADEPNFEVLVNGVATKNYTIHYTDRNGNFDHSKDWQGGDLSAWKTTKDNSTRSFRLEIKDQIPKGAVVKISFNGKIDGKAEPGQIAWNSFGYEYKYTKNNITTWLYAAPLNVGVGIPAAPQIVKKLVNSNNFGVTAKENMDFTFVIYKGETINFSGYDKTAVGNALSGREFTVINVTVPKGAGVSEKVILDTLGNESIYKYVFSGGNFNTTSQLWRWENGTKYNAVEIDANFNDYSFGYINNETDTKRNYTFTYNPLINEEIVFVNERADWHFKLVKTDKKDSSIKLAGAVFGIYSADSKQALSDAEYDSLKVKYKFDKSFVKRVIENNGINYYLAYVIESDNNGLAEKTGLTDDIYVVKEIIAPSGYNINEESFVIRYSESDADRILTKEIKNESGVVLPETGGSGAGRLLEYLGGLLALLSILLIILKNAGKKRVI